MKKTVLLLCGLLLFTGCGTSKEPAFSTNSTNSSEVTTECETDDDAYYADQLCFCNVEITGIETKYEDTYNMHMYDGKVTELASDYLIAEGHLTDEWHNTVDSVSVLYEIVDNYIDSGKIIEDSTLTLTPSTPFTVDCLYNENTEIGFANTDLQNLPLTKENFPSIELIDSWDNNYTYKGHAIYTDKDGNKWITSDDHGTNPFYYDGSEDGPFTWKFSSTPVIVVKFE